MVSEDRGSIVNPMQAPELLAPVGNDEALIAAVQNGADAVYFGGARYNARANASNFQAEALASVLNYCRLRGVKTYFTLNTLLNDRDLPTALRLARDLYLLGIDALIIQDFGLARLIRQALPEINLHASTQMTIHNAQAASFLLTQGFTRIIAARELSLEQLQALRTQAGIDIECFIHGALCLAYSGQCLMSSFLFKRSGNRGVCAQPCRLRYSLQRQESDGTWTRIRNQAEHLLSPKDLCAAALLPDLLRAGVRALKIEGRMRSAAYVGVVTRFYRQLIDGQTADLDSDEVRKVFNRDFTVGFIGRNPRGYINPESCDNLGYFIGSCSAHDPRTSMIELVLEHPLAIGDGVRVDREFKRSDDEIGGTISELWLEGRPVTRAEQGQRVSFRLGGRIKPGSKVYKTFDKDLTDKIRTTYEQGKELRKVQIQARLVMKLGLPVRLTFSDGQHTVSAESTVAVERARNRPMSCESLREQFSRLGHTPFVLDSFACEMDSEVIIPLSELGKLRKLLIEKLIEARTKVARSINQTLFDAGISACESFTNPAYRLAPKPAPKNTTISVHVDSLPSVEAACLTDCEAIIVGNGFKRPQLDLAAAKSLIQAAGKQFILATPLILFTQEVAPEAAKVQALKPDSVLVANLGLLHSLLEAPGSQPPVHLDYTFNLTNQAAISGYVALSSRIQRLCLSLELPASELRDLANACSVETEALVHGDLVLMTSEYCIFHEDCRQQCQAGYAVVDRLNLKFPVKGLAGCRMAILNSKKLSTIKCLHRFAAALDGVRLDLRTYPSEQISRIVKAYRQASSGGKVFDNELTGPTHTTGWTLGVDKGRQ